MPQHQQNSAIERQFLEALRERLGFKTVSERTSDGWRDVWWGDERGNRDTTLKLFTRDDGSMSAIFHLHSASRLLRDGKKANAKGNVFYSQAELSITQTSNLASILFLTEEHLAKCKEVAYGAMSRSRGCIAQEHTIAGMGKDDKAVTSSYVERKGIRARHDGSPPVHHQVAGGRDSVSIPLFQLVKTGDAIKCHLINRQSIDANSDKRFQKGVITKGLCYPFGLGFDPKTQTLTVTQPARIFLGEGYATTATIHEATGQPAVVALNTGNLSLIAGQLARTFPKTEIVICADNDITTERKRGHNPGEQAAIQAAREIQLQRALAGTPLAAQPATHIITPLLEDLDELRLAEGNKESDFNDAWVKHYREAKGKGVDDDSARERAYALVRDAITDGLSGGAHAIDAKEWKLVPGTEFNRLQQEAVKEQLLAFAQDLNDAVGPNFASLANGANAPGFGVVYQQGFIAASQQTLRLNAPGAAVMAAACATGVELDDVKKQKFETALQANWGVECLMVHARAKNNGDAGAAMPFWVATQRDKDGNATKILPLTNSHGKHFMQQWLTSIVRQAKDYTESSTPYRKDATDAAAYERAAGLRALQRVCSANRVLYLNIAPQPNQPCRDVWETVTSVNKCDDVLRGAAAQLAQRDVHLLRRFRFDAAGITVSERTGVFLGKGAPKEAQAWFMQQGMRPSNAAGAKVYTCDAAQLKAFAAHIGANLDIPLEAFERPIRVVNPDYLAKLLPATVSALASQKITMEEWKESLAASSALLPQETRLQLSATQQGLLAMSVLSFRRSKGLESIPGPEQSPKHTSPPEQGTSNMAP
ncbi:MAG: toprim domain-containing protein [Actinomycetaceae bacterium]|nr:toprim domain-containing protein [Actinomycetaceae bacterium]